MIKKLCEAVSWCYAIRLNNIGAEVYSLTWVNMTRQDAELLRVSARWQRKLGEERPRYGTLLNNSMAMVIALHGGAKYDKG
jgi:hypothetical protein